MAITRKGTTAKVEEIIKRLDHVRENVRMGLKGPQFGMARATDADIVRMVDVQVAKYGPGYLAELPFVEDGPELLKRYTEAVASAMAAQEATGMAAPMDEMAVGMGMASALGGADEMAVGMASASESALGGEVGGIA